MGFGLLNPFTCRTLSGKLAVWDPLCSIVLLQLREATSWAHSWLSSVCAHARAYKRPHNQGCTGITR